VMATWADLPSELRRFIITMGKEIITEEFLTHQESFQGCLFDISHRHDRNMHVCMHLSRRYTCPLYYSNFMY